MRRLALGAAGLVACLLLLGGGPWWTSGGGPVVGQWPPPDRSLEVPDGGFDIRYAQAQVDLAGLIAQSVVRLDAVHVRQAPYDPETPDVQDGAGTVVAEGRLLTTARYLVGAGRIYAVLRDGGHLPVTVRRLDRTADLALLAFDPKAAPHLRPVDGVAPVPPPTGSNGASIVVFPASLEGDGVSLRIAAALRGKGALFLSGQALNGVPAFDTRGRLVAVAIRMTPDRTRSLGIGGRALAAWLGAGGVADGGVADGGVADGGLADGGLADGGLADGGVADGGAADAEAPVRRKKTGPRAERGGRGP